MFRVWGEKDSEKNWVGRIRFFFLVVVDSYAIAPPPLIPFSLSFSTKKRRSSRGKGEGVTRWGLFLMRGVNYFIIIIIIIKVCSFYTHTLSLSLVPCS